MHTDTLSIDIIDHDLAGSPEPDAPRLSAPLAPAVLPDGEHLPTTLAAAEAQLQSFAARYNQSGEEQFSVLTTICLLIFTLKQLFEQTPRRDRPTRTWAKYAPAVAKRCGLRFVTDRMADNYARLYIDMKTVGLGEIQKRVSDGSYREARKAANELLKKGGKKPNGTVSCTLLRQAAQFVRKAMDAAFEEGRLRSLATLQETLSKAARADRMRTKDVVPEMPAFGFPDLVRHRINYAVRAASVDPIAAGIHAFDQYLFDAAPPGEGAITFPAWSRPKDVTLPLTDTGVSKWAGSLLQKRNALLAALVRRFDPGVATQVTNQTAAEQT